MTCIVGVAIDGEVYIGADSVGATSSKKNTYEKPKVFHNDDFIIGYTSSFRMGQILEFSWEPPVREYNKEGTEFKIQDDYKYLVKKVVPSIQKAFEDNGYDKKTNDGESKGGEFILGYNGNVYVVQNDFSVLQPSDNYISVGSGLHVALGSLASTEYWFGDNTIVEERIRLAIETAEKYIPTVQGPVHIKVLS